MKKTKQNIYSALIIIYLVLLQSSFFLKAEHKIYGYFENRLFLLDVPDETEEDISFSDRYKLGDYNRLRLNLQTNLSKKISVITALDFFTFHGILQSPLGTYDETTDPLDSQKDVTIDVDRIYVNLYFKKFDLSIGKQRLALGVSYIWAPLDIFNRVNILDPKEEKPGANAIKLYVPVNTGTSITGIFSPEDDFHSSTSALRAKTQLWKTDIALNLMYDGTTETSIYGLDIRGEKLIGWWIEAGYFVKPDPEAIGYDVYNKDIKMVLGFDYTFPFKNGLYWLNEFYYDTTGEKNPARYNFDLVESGERFTLGRIYYYSMLRYNFSGFLSATFSYIANCQKGDGSFILNPMIQYIISRNILFTTGFYFPCGNKDGELRKNNSRVFFAWLKINF